VAAPIMTSTNSKPSLDSTSAQVASVIGKHLLVGLTHRGLDDQVASIEQFHGIIDRVNLQEGLVVKLYGTGEERSLPLDLSGLEKADPGQYRLKTTGEVVANPDFTLMWTIYPKGYKADNPLMGDKMAL
jgi:hypothetical protein